MDKIINNRKFRLLLACISLLILVNLVQETYAKYVSSADATSNLTIARWAFTVNNQDIIANSNFSNTIVPVFDQNANIDSGVIAPTSTGYFDITIDSSNVGVSFDEVITLAASDSNTVDDLVFTGYKKNDDEVAWIDGTGETMDNEADTEASQTGTAAVSVNIRFIQKASN